ncbi:cytosine permease [Lentzea sp. NPDC042327]|uniref:purine-cytosine permease family protein n=1 Tax=Lentzea sp. NPDC042327 TaxID=3154801 RepID=UPI00340DF684
MSTPQKVVVETRGVDVVPDEERTSSPGEFFWIWNSAQFSLGTVVLGSVPVAFGLGWWASISSLLIGLLIGTVVVAPLVRFGKATGANDPVSSGAHFGVRGRVIGNVITVCAAIGFFSIAVWTGATAILFAGQRLLGTPADGAALAVVAPVVAVVVVLVAVYGHAVLLATYRVMTIIGAAVLLGLVVVLLPEFDPGYAGGAYALGDFTRTWLLAVTFSATVPISYSTFQGDYSRYLPRSVSDRTAVWWNGSAMYLSNAVALGVGAFVTTLLTDPGKPWIIGVAGVVPAWFAVVVVAYGLAGTLPQGGLCIYAAGLSAQSIFWRLSRPVATVLVSVVGVSALYVGAVVYDAIDSISAFVLVLLVFVAPWAAIMLVGYRQHGGRYSAADLLAFTSAGQGRYWYTGGFNLRAVCAFVPSVLLGLLFVGNTLYTGPLAGLAGGIDLSAVVPFVVAAVLYDVLCRLFPERVLAHAD